MRVSRTMRLVSRKEHDEREEQDGKSLQYHAPLHEAVGAARVPTARHVHDPEREDAQSAQHRDQDQDRKSIMHATLYSAPGESRPAGLLENDLRPLREVPMRFSLTCIGLVYSC